MENKSCTTLLAFLLPVVCIISSCTYHQNCKQNLAEEINVSGFNKIQLSEEIPVEIKVCTNSNYSVTAKGCINTLADLELMVTDSVLSVKYKHANAHGSITSLEITSPVMIEVGYFKTPKVRRYHHQPTASF